MAYLWFRNWVLGEALGPLGVQELGFRRGFGVWVQSQGEELMAFSAQGSKPRSSFQVFAYCEH